MEEAMDAWESAHGVEIETGKPLKDNQFPGPLRRHKDGTWSASALWLGVIHYGQGHSPTEAAIDLHEKMKEETLKAYREGTIW